ncbi:hypothetical protein FOCC_FOCC012888 [Frankliniella occidentalis]|nr:hypothetical protein FOCC_FOCC012888 [Frankliniella occidentalis]
MGEVGLRLAAMAVVHHQTSLLSCPTTHTDTHTHTHERASMRVCLCSGGGGGFCNAKQKHYTYILVTSRVEDGTQRPLRFGQRPPPLSRTHAGSDTH